MVLQASFQALVVYVTVLNRNTLTDLFQIVWHFQVEHYLDETIAAAEGDTVDSFFSPTYSRAFFLDDQCLGRLINLLP